MSMFDENDFLSASNEAVLDEKFNLVAEGEYKAQIGFDDKDFTVTKGEKDGKPWAQLALRLEILDPTGDIEKALGRKPMMTDRFFLDLDENGRPDYSRQRNIRLGQYLAATDSNKPGWKPNDMRGKPFKITVRHVKSDLNPGEKRAQVTMLGRA